MERQSVALGHPKPLVVLRKIEAGVTQTDFEKQSALLKI